MASSRAKPAKKASARSGRFSAESALLCKTTGTRSIQTLPASDAMSRNVEGPLMEQAAHEGLLDEARAWALCMALARRASTGRPVAQASGLRLGAGGELQEVSLGAGHVDVDPERESGLAPGVRLPASVAAMFELYLPLCLTPAGAAVYAHVGQSLDGQIA